MLPLYRTRGTEGNVCQACLPVVQQSRMGLDKELTGLGLSPKEAKVYLALLELGTASAQAIARRAGIVRPTTYVILETLARKGLASKATGPDAKKMLFAAEAPERLQAFLQQQKQKIEQQRQDLDRLLPELRSLLLRGEDKPRVRLFEGKEGLQVLQEEFISSGRGPVEGLVSLDDLYALFPEPEFHERIRAIRLKAGLATRQVCATSQPTPKVEEDRRYLRESRYISRERFPFRGSFYVNGPILSIVSLQSKIIGVLIEHQDISDAFRAIFHLAWEAAGRDPSQPPP